MVVDGGHRHKVGLRQPASKGGLGTRFRVQVRIHDGSALSPRYKHNRINDGCLAPRHGFEPRFTAPKAAVLPLDDRGKYARETSSWLRSTTKFSAAAVPTLGPARGDHPKMLVVEEARVRELLTIKKRCFPLWNRRYAIFLPTRLRSRCAAFWPSRNIARYGA